MEGLFLYNQTYDNILQKGTAIALRLRMYYILPDGMLGKGNG